MSSCDHNCDNCQSSCDKNKSLLAKAPKDSKIKKIIDKKAALELNVKEYDREIRDREAARLAAIEEEKRLKRESAKRKRELKKLEELMEKYYKLLEQDIIEQPWSYLWTHRRWK